MTYRDTQRMEVRSLIRLASDIVAPFSPMTVFVHHNPLHHLESLDFEEAVSRAARLLGSQGYLPNHQYRRYVESGRIGLDHVDQALRARIEDKAVMLGDRRVTHGEVLRAALLHDLTPPPDQRPRSEAGASEERPIVEVLSERLRAANTADDGSIQMKALAQDTCAVLASRETLTVWCDRTFDSRLTPTLNQQLIKWCATFLDEGQATWEMPGRERGFYETWKRLAAKDWTLTLSGVRGWRHSMEQLPDHAEDAILDSLHALAVPKALWSEYFALHLAAMPGWSAYIKWRSEQQTAWQEACPISLVKYIAVRLFYERVLVTATCRAQGLEGRWDAIQTFIEHHPQAYALQRAQVAGRLPREYARRVRSLRQNREAGQWETLFARYQAEWGAALREDEARTAAERLLALVRALKIEAAALRDAAPSDLDTLLGWLAAFPEHSHGPIWLAAFEASYQERLLVQLTVGRDLQLASAGDLEVEVGLVRPQAQAVFCIDVRSEPLRRHFEEMGDYDTFGFAGFFAIPLRYRPFASTQETSQCPVVVKPKHVVREVPRSYQARAASKHRSRLELLHTGHALLRDLKENVITPYVMVEAVGWFFVLPFVGKTLLPVWSRRLRDWLQSLYTPEFATTLTVDKLSRDEAQEILVTEQRAAIRRVLQERFGLRASAVSPELIEAVRKRALNEKGEGTFENVLHQAGIPPSEALSLIEDLRRLHHIDSRWAGARMARITQMGFTPAEQAFYVENALRMMGLTRNFARLIFLCGHRSTSDNNPYESALDCGACGGNRGMPNARILAAMANKPAVREALGQRGLVIPLDTQFVAGEHDTTTDEVRFFDLEDVPATHRKDLLRLMTDLEEAGRLTSRERAARLPDAGDMRSPAAAARHMQLRSADWSQVRPEWGLSGNAAFVVGRRLLTRRLDLEGRVFLHSYDWRTDPTGKSLEIVLTAPGLVTEWINMEHYFSTVDNEVFGSGSKVYHNVVGRFGVMSGTESDLRVGLAHQTVMNGEQPYHEPMRLLVIVEAPCDRITAIVRRHELLQHYYDRRWLHLVARDPVAGRWYRYVPRQQWQELIPAPTMDVEQQGETPWKR